MNDPEGEIQRSLGRIEGKLDGALDVQSETIVRLSEVEKKLWYQSGIFAAAGALIAWFVKGGSAWS